MTSPRTTAGARPRQALLLIDVVNALDFPGSRGLVRAASRAAPRIHRLTTRARGVGIPVVYVNDNFGQWRSDFRAIIAGCTAAGRPGAAVSALLTPEDGDYFVLKPHYSGFFGTPLDLLLRDLGVETLVIVGFAANRCVLFTANDAYLHGYRVVVPADCTAANTPSLARAALAHVEEALGGSTIRGDRIALHAAAGRPRGTRRRST